jgi:hypothetical protein
MAYYSVGEAFGIDKAILRYAHGNFHTVHVTVPRTKLSLNSEYKRAVPAGLFVAEETPTQYRFLPRAVVTDAASTASNTFKVDLFYLFVPGDKVQILEPNTVLNITSVSPGQTATVSIFGRGATATANTSDPVAFASVVADAVNHAPYVNDFLEARAAGSQVYLISKNNQILDVTYSGTATATLTKPRTTVESTPIGTVANVSQDGTIKLEANALMNVPANVRIGVPVQKVLGLDIHARDFVTAPVRNIALLTESTAVETRFLPYIDSDLVQRFPRINFDNRW